MTVTPFKVRDVPAAPNDLASLKRDAAHNNSCTICCLDLLAVTNNYAST